MRADLRSVVGWAITGVLAAIVIAGFVMGDPEPADRLDSLGSSIKCPVCQGEAIIDSPSPTAKAMMEVLEEKVAAGETDQQIYAYFTARFGDGIVLDPPLEPKTIFVWLAPFLAIGGGLWMIATRRRKPTPETEHAEAR
jgi:cytochrome c-type biogenesis protein CcmH